MILALALAPIAWPAVTSGDRGLRGGTPRDNAAEKKTTPSGTWKGICSDGGPDWGDPMPIELTFRVAEGRDDDQLAVDAVIDFESDKKEPRRATATLKGKRNDGPTGTAARWQLRGTMTDAKDATEWEIELDTVLEGTRLSGRLIETDNNDALMCRFSWTKPAK